LPNLSVCYTPLKSSDAGTSRDTYGLRPDSVVYHCCQSLYKFLPRYDEVFPRIAQQVGNCQFLFASFPKSRSVIEKFRSRIGKIFKRFNLSAEDHIVFSPFLEIEEYQALNSIADVLLDPVGWSGCTTAFEAIDFNLPVVTFPGELMRGRAAAAILKMMGITETIADNLDGYIEVAVHLGSDPERRRQISDRIASNKCRAYGDKACIGGLEQFIERVAKGK
jgi:protein O-GlcNAc transferase